MPVTERTVVRRRNRELWETGNTGDMRDAAENKMYFLEKQETRIDLNREVGYRSKRVGCFHLSCTLATLFPQKTC